MPGCTCRGDLTTSGTNEVKGVMSRATGRDLVVMRLTASEPRRHNAVPGTIEGRTRSSCPTTLSLPLLIQYTVNRVGYYEV